jgi:hypothetical protein
MRREPHKSHGQLTNENEQEDGEDDDDDDDDDDGLWIRDVLGRTLSN